MRHCQPQQQYRRQLQRQKQTLPASSVQPASQPASQPVQPTSQEAIHFVTWEKLHGMAMAYRPTAGPLDCECNSGAMELENG